MISISSISFKMQKNSVSIIIPTLNEAENINLLLTRIFAVKELQAISMEVVFSDGASTDDTAGCVNSWTKTHPVCLLRNENDNGLAAAVMAGAKIATGEYAVVMDADLSHSPEDIPHLLAPLFAGTHDMVIGSRYTDGGDTPEWPTSRKISSKLATYPARLLTDVEDPLAGFIALKRSRLTSLDREVCGFKIGLELLATAETQLRVKEIPIIFHDRCYGTSKMSIGVIVDYIRQLHILAGVHPFMGGSPAALLALLCLMIAIDFSVLTVILQRGTVAGWAHVLSLATAVLGGGIFSAFIYPLKQVATETGRALLYIPGVAAITILTLFLRSGLVRIWLNSAENLSISASFVLAVFGVSLCYIGIVIFVFSIGRKRIRGELVLRFYGMGIVGYTLVLRLIYSSALALLPTERSLMNQLEIGAHNSQSHILPLPAMFAGLSMHVAGVSTAGFRFSSGILWLASATVIYSLARDMYDRGVAFRAVLLFSVLPYFMGIGLYVSNDTIFTLFWSLTLLYLYRALVLGVKGGWFWAGLVMGVAIQFRAFAAVLPLALIVYLIADHRQSRWLGGSGSYIALGAITLSFLPWIVFGTSPFVPSEFTGPGWLESIAGFGIDHSLLAPLILLTPTGVLAAGYCCMRWCRPAAIFRNQCSSVNQHNRLFNILFFFLPLLVALVFLGHSGYGEYFGAVSWIVLLPSIALTISLTRLETTGTMDGLLPYLWWFTIISLVFFYGTALHYAVL